MTLNVSNHVVIMTKEELMERDHHTFQRGVSRGKAEAISGLHFNDVDWTLKDGHVNSSDLYLTLVDEMSKIIKDGAHSLLAGDVNSVARVIVAQLAHVHNFGPLTTKEESNA